MFFFKKNTGGTDMLIVGLGNIGKEYDNTRHNVGFMAIDELARRQNVAVSRLKYRAKTAQTTIKDTRIFLMKPTTYMNLSGESIIEAMQYYKLNPDQVLVITDDTSLPVGSIRIRRKGSAGGHNGLKSIIKHLATEAFPRIKIGVGDKPHPDYDMAKWVLSRFSPQESKQLNDAITNTCDAVELMLAEHIDAAMAKYN